jgi:hypothetical protein
MDDFSRGAGDQVRIGDAERDSAAAALGEHYSEGRLDRVELDARLTQALAARTRDDLAVLFADLPKGGELVEHAQQPPSPRAAWAGPGIFLPRLVLPIAVAAAIFAMLHGIPPFFLIPVLWAVRAGRRGRLRPGTRCRW